MFVIKENYLIQPFISYLSPLIITHISSQSLSHNSQFIFYYTVFFSFTDFSLHISIWMGLSFPFTNQGKKVTIIFLIYIQNHKVHRKRIYKFQHELYFILYQIQKKKIVFFTLLSNTSTIFLSLFLWYLL